jgi:hypothetical protein
VIHALAAAWQEMAVAVEPLAMLTDAVRRKCSVIQREENARDWVSTTPEEVDYVVSRLLGQGRHRVAAPRPVDQRGTQDDRDAVRSIGLEFQTKGRSRSVVASGRPVFGAGYEGVYCVMKLSRRDEAAEERDRYEQHVRLGVSSERRVELLGSAMGDVIGGLCYGFAGRSPGSVTDLEALLDEESDRALEVFGSLFGPDATDWSGTEMREEGSELTEFFSDAYSLEVSPVVMELRRFAESNAQRWGCTFRGDGLYFGQDGSERIALPEERDSALAALRNEYDSSIVHGDLNAANVMVADDGRVMLIDFRHTARGPRLIDAAALQTSIRLSRCAVADVSTEVLKSHRLEEKLLSEMGGAGFARVPGGASSLPYWGRASWHLINLARDRYADVSVDEYAATCLLYAIRVLRVTQVDELPRLRLLAWTSALLGRLRRAAGG